MVFDYIAVIIGSAILSILFTLVVKQMMMKLGKVGVDVHKPELPKVPESVGLSISITLLTVIGLKLLTMDSTDELFVRLLISLFMIMAVSIVGIWDDFRPLSAVMKPFVLLVISIPIGLLRIGDPYLAIPFVGELRLTIVYWLLATFVITITSNSANMIDVLNGSLSGSFIIIGLVAFVSTFIIPLDPVSLQFARFLSLALIGSLLGFWIFNRYPAKVFAGDAGSLVTGAVVGLIAVYGELEFVLIIAILPMIMNSFSILSSVGGLLERRQMKERPVKVEDGIISANPSPHAPITLVRMIVASKPLTEKEVVNRIYRITTYSGLLAIVTALLIGVELS